MHGLIIKAMHWNRHLVLPVLVVALAACGGGGSTSASGSAGGGGGSGGSSSSPSSQRSGILASAAYTISWDGVSDPAVTGYRVYFDYAPLGSGRTPSHVDVSASTVSLLPGNHGILVGDTLYVAVASKGAGGAESPVSSQVSVVAE